jgi:hypothetical protein
VSIRQPIVALANVATVIACTLVPLGAVADVQTMLNAPAWQLDYEVTFKSEHEGSGQSLHGPVTYFSSLQGTFNAAVLFNLRNAGAGGVSMSKAAVGTNDSALSTAEQQQRIMDLVMRTETMANWMPTPPIPGDDEPFEEQQAAMLAYMEAQKATAHVDCHFKTVGVNLFNETGSEYDLVSRRTLSGSGKVVVAFNLSFELDAQSHHYLLTLAHEFKDEAEGQALQVTIDTVTFKGDPPAETKTEQVAKLDLASSILIDDPKMQFGQILLIEGDFDPASEKITGERTIPAYYLSADTKVPGTLLVKYTLTPRE